MMKIAVLFPGIGYHCDKPLLYYAGKLAAQHGFGEVVRVSYAYNGGNIRGNAEAMRAAFDALYAQAAEALSDIKWEQYEEILFISKSIGTCVAAAYAERNGLAVRHILYTPLKETFRIGTFCKEKRAAHPEEGSKAAPHQQTNQHVPGDESANAISFIGTADAWSDAEEIRRLCMDSKIPLTVIPDANHSLETGNALRDIEILRDVMGETLNYIASPAF
jgi:phosphoglycolate phosphatase